MTEFQLTSHYNGEVNIKYYPTSHRYQRVGCKDYLIGVTTATSVLDKSRPLLIWAGRLTEEYISTALKNGVVITEKLIGEAVRQHELRKEEAATSGTKVHQWVELYIRGLKPPVPVESEVKNGVLAFLRWVEKEEIRFISSEKRIYSKEYDYVGTMDCSFTKGIDQHKYIYAGDFKTGFGVYFDHVAQVAAYQAAETEEHSTLYAGKYIIRFAKEDKYDKFGNLTQVAGNFITKYFSPDYHKDHFKAFLSCLEIKKQLKVWEKEYGFYAKK